VKPLSTTSDADVANNIPRGPYPLPGE